MTIRVGANPSNQVYIGQQTSSAANTYTGTGAVSMRFRIETPPNVAAIIVHNFYNHWITSGLGSSSTAQPRTITGSGAISLKSPAFELFAVHPVIRRGPGTVSLKVVNAGGSGTQTQHPSGSGAVTSKVRISGTAIRSVASVDQYDADGALSHKITISGDAVRSLQYVTGSGDISLGSMEIHDIPQAVAEPVFIDGVFLEPVYMQGIFEEPIYLDGVG